MNLVSPERSRNMSRIKGKNTTIELEFAKQLRKNHIKYRKHPKIPGNPDFYLPDYKTVVFLDGCFWHKCPKHYQEPKTRTEFWRNKINGNVKRDKKTTTELRKKFKIIRVFECKLDSAISRILKIIR